MNDLSASMQVHELGARLAWNSNPALAYTYADFGDFLQSYMISAGDGVTDHIDKVLALNYSADLEQSSIAKARILSARRPLASGANPTIAERRGHRLVMWFYGPFSLHDSLTPAIAQSPACQAIEEHADAQAIILRIDSCGGTSRVAEFIANRLQQHRARKIAIIDRECLSAANFLTVASDRVLMRRDAVMMLHPHTLDTFGNADQLAERAKDLRQRDELLLRRLAIARGISPDSLRPVHKSAKFLTAPEALALGLVDQIIAPLPPCAVANAAGTPEETNRVQ